MKKYMVYLEDRDNVYRIPVPANDPQDAIKWTEGNGDLVAVKDVTGDYPIRTERVSEALLRSGFTSVEVYFLTRALECIGMTN